MVVINRCIQALALVLPTFAQVSRKGSPHNDAIATLQNCIGQQQAGAGCGFGSVTSGHCFVDPLEGAFENMGRKEGQIRVSSVGYQ